MKTKEQIQSEIAKLQEELKTLENQDFKVIEHKGKEFRIYEWENKPFKDFPMPKGFTFAEANLIDELINLEKFKPELYKWYVFKQRYPKINKYHGLSRLCLNGDLDLRSDDEDLADSDSGGRVIIQK